MILGGVAGIILLLIACAGAMAMNFNTAFVPGPLDNNLRLESSITKTADFAGTAFDLGSGFAAGGAGQPFSAVVDVSAFDFTTEDETYAVTIQESADNSTWANISPAVDVGATGVKAIPVFVSSRYVRINLDVGGTSPSITYEGWLVPHQ
jgi:hypothetical protein